MNFFFIEKAAINDENFFKKNDHQINHQDLNIDILRLLLLEE